MAGQLAGIAIRSASRGTIACLERAVIGATAGIEGDFRGALAARKNAPGRAVSLMEAESWARATKELGVEEPWWKRRANLLLEGLRLPRRIGTLIRIGETCLLQISMECDPCSRMEEVSPGLRKGLEPDWRGGFRARVIEPGDVAVGDAARIEER